MTTNEDTKISIAVTAVVTTQTFNTLTLELVSCDLVPGTEQEKPPLQVGVNWSSSYKNEWKYEGNFSVQRNFGDIGAVCVENKHDKEVYIKKIELIVSNDPVHITCNSYVQPSHKRIFFSNKSYLPCETPNGLRKLREVELKNLRGDGQGVRQETDRIYDYDVYNDLGNRDMTRVVLGTDKHPYPRRCRTGRQLYSGVSGDPPSEIRSNSIYVPRDEAFSDVKIQETSGVFSEEKRAPAMKMEGETFPRFSDIDSFMDQLYTKQSALRFKTPQMIKVDKFSWMKDEEFSRQTLAGINPCTIQLVTIEKWPLKSDLNDYGPPESAITKEVVEQQIKGFMKLEEALEKQKLFMLDYHDLLLPYVNKVRALSSTSFQTTLYGSRTLFFLTPDGTLRPVAIELTRPPLDGKPQWKKVFTPHWTATECWLWRLAKAHVLAHDSAIHQLVSHWLRTHCCVEPYVIATNRQLSAMHPIYRLLHPHLRYTMGINALARKILISADGIIESSFSTGKYSMELSSDAYAQQWKFNLQALPADLIDRGMAVKDDNAKHGLKLAIEDYPFANDGLLLWDAIKKWVDKYSGCYYKEESQVKDDKELQAWWTEIKTVGHKDKKEGWPELNTRNDLIEILTTMIWVASGHHAAVNFGQYDYAAYFPNRPTIARKNMPTEEPTDEKNFWENPEATLLGCFPSRAQALKVMGILNVLSNHSPDEEYLGEKIEAAWNEEPMIKEAFESFNSELKEIEKNIHDKNKDKKLKNRCGAGVVPYELLKPFSESGVTGKGVPNSISI